MNNIKSSGKMRSQKAWPNIMTKVFSRFFWLHYKHTQTFGNGLVAALDTNSNHQPLNDLGGLQVIDDAASIPFLEILFQQSQELDLKQNIVAISKHINNLPEMLQEVGTLPRSLDSKLLP